MLKCTETQVQIVNTQTMKLMKRPTAERKCQMSWLS